jgi:hypothetical protein
MRKTRKSLPKKIKDLRNPNTLKTGHIAKLSGNKYVIVIRDKKGNARYIPASKKDIKCDKTLKKNVKEMIDEVKSKKNKNYKQALAIAYSKTLKKYPRCKLLSQNKTKKQKAGGLFNFFKSTPKKLKKKILNQLIKKRFIKKDKNIKADIKDLLNNDTNFESFIKFINKSLQNTTIDTETNIDNDDFVLKVYAMQNTGDKFYQLIDKTNNNTENNNNGTNNNGTYNEIDKYKKLLNFVKKNKKKH